MKTLDVGQPTIRPLFMRFNPGSLKGLLQSPADTIVVFLIHPGRFGKNIFPLLRLFFNFGAEPREQRNFGQLHLGQYA